MNIKNDSIKVLLAFLDRILSVILNVVIASLVARYLGVIEFGHYQFILSYCLIAQTITWVIPTEILISFIKPNSNFNIKLISTVYFGRLIISLFLIIVISLLTLIFIDVPYFKSILFICFCTAILEAAGVYKFLFDYSGNTEIGCKIRISCSLVKFLFVLLLIKLDLFNIPNLLVIVGLEFLFIAYLYKSLGVRLTSIKYDKFSTKVLFYLLKKGWPIFLGLVLTYLFYRYDRFYMNSILEKEVFGVYSAAVNIIDQVITVIIMICTVFSSKYILHGNFEKYKNRIYTSIILTSVIFYIGFFIFGGFIINLIYGPSFSASFDITLNFLFITPFVFLQQVLLQRIFAMKKFKFFIYLSIMNFISHILIIKILSEYLSYYSVLISYITNYTISIYLTRHALRDSNVNNSNSILQ